MLAFMCEAYEKEKGEDRHRTRPAPGPQARARWKVAVLPLVKKEGMPECAR